MGGRPKSDEEKLTFRPKYAQKNFGLRPRGYLGIPEGGGGGGGGIRGGGGGGGGEWYPRYPPGLI